MLPEELCEQEPDSEAHQLFPLKVFRDHTHQEERTAKCIKERVKKRDGERWKEFRSKEEESSGSEGGS